MLLRSLSNWLLFFTLLDVTFLLLFLWLWLFQCAIGSLALLTLFFISDLACRKESNTWSKTATSSTGIPPPPTFFVSLRLRLFLPRCLVISTYAIFLPQVFKI